ncbi:hypothetical protein T265_07329 [Opisthorchis viverrini]|uniref:Uncharacterized protein n=1 Tax=Opisthorchis viverrini TaxID=6198 RepID=A0A074ZHI7_OPIVI|nr:hypothetical protein T265_07329 [Opisthorchis viverrini]KER25167.1 hypothetical protein T265_07329 [Opisthorchis viverrini]
MDSNFLTPNHLMAVMAARYGNARCREIRYLQINLVFTRDSSESLIYDILQLNVLHTNRLMIQLARYSGFRSLGNLKISLLSCSLLEAWQLGTERVLQLNDLPIPTNRGQLTQ